MKNFNLSLVIVTTLLSAMTVSANKVDNTVSESTCLSMETESSCQAIRLEIIGTTGNQIFTGVEPGQDLIISGIGTPNSISYEGGAIEALPYADPTIAQQGYTWGGHWGDDWMDFYLVFSYGVLVEINTTDTGFCN